MSWYNVAVGRLLALSLIVVGALACGGSRAAPTGALDRYAAALRAKNYDAAYALMSSEFRARVERDEFVRMLRDNPREVEDTAKRLGGSSRKLELSAELRYGLGDSLVLIEEGGQWRIADNPLAFYDQSTPRATLRAFVRAYRLERWDVMLRMVPRAYADRMNVEILRTQFTGPRAEDMAQLMNRLEANLTGSIEELGPAEAALSYGAGRVTLVREDGRWRIKDLE